ncbi:MAG: GNAT family N-acetyltransferase [Rhodoglobus sp.]
MSTTAETSGASLSHIRSARPGDTETIFALLEQLAKSYTPDRVAFDQNIGSFLGDDPGSLLLVAEDAAGQVRGYALTTINSLLHTNGRSAQLQELVVDEQVKGTGIGTRLIEELERICRDRGVKQLTVPSRRAASFYERLGYQSTADFLKKTFD